MSGIRVKTKDNTTLGWVAIDPDGTVRLHGFSEALGAIMKSVRKGGGWIVEDIREHRQRGFHTRMECLEWLWNCREAHLQSRGW